MKWSISTTKMFQYCPRKYYYQQIVADKKSDDSRAKESVYLRSLQNLYAWRGNLVDGVISKYIAPKINSREEIQEKYVMIHAKELMRNDLEHIKNSIGKATEIGNSYGFFELEYGKEITEDFIAKIEQDIITSLNNVLASDLLARIIEDQSYVIAQRTIRFSMDELKISCTPDLIVFPKHDTPQIIDWKVESVYREHWLQLGIYGYALSKINPHRDFPDKWHGFIADPRNIKLVEYQLLRNEQENYQIKDEDIIEIEDYIHVSSNKIAKLVGDGKNVDMDKFPTTTDPRACQRCQYKKMCWREMNK